MNNQPIKILLIEKKVKDYDWMCCLLSEKPWLQLDHATTYQEGLAAIERQVYDIYLVGNLKNFANPQEHPGLKLLKTAKARGYQAPMLLLTQHHNAALNLAALQAGALATVETATLDAALLEGFLQYAWERQQAANPAQIPATEFHPIWEQLPIGIAQLDLKGQFLWSNQKFCHFLGYSLPELLTKTFFELTHPDDCEMDRQQRQRLIAGEISAFSREKRYYKQDGSIFWGKVTVSLVRTPTGKPYYYIAILEDIQERKQIQDALQASEMRLSGILDIANDAIISINESQRITLFNKGAANLFGYTPEEVMGQPLDLLMPLNFAAIHQAHINNFIHSPDIARRMGERSEIRARHKDGTEFPAEASISKLTLGNEIILTVILRDVTERKQAEEILRDSEERYRSVINVMAEGVTLQQADGKIIACNPSAENILGLQSEKVVSMTVRDPYWHPIREDGSPFPFEDRPSVVTLRTGKPQSNVVIGIYKPDHTISWVSVNSQPLFKPDQSLPYAVVTSFADITQRKQIELELRRLATILEASSDYIAIADTTGQIIWNNPAAKRVLGLSADADVSSQKISDYHPPWVLDLIQNQGIPTAMQQGTWMGETALLWADGQEMPVSQLIIAHKSVQGEVEYFSTIMRDITTLKQTEAALKESEEKFRQLSASIREVFFLTSVTGQILYISPGYEEIWGRSCESLYQNPRSWLEAIYPDDYPAILAAFNTQVQEKTDFDHEYRIIQPQGQIRWIRSQSFPIHNQAGEVYRFAGIAEDITERKQAEAALRASEKRYRQIVETAQEGIWLIDANAKTVYCNPQMAEMLGYTVAEVQERSLFDFMDAQACQEAQERFGKRQQGIQEQHDFRFTRKDGSDVWTLISTTSIFDENQQFQGALGMIMDITERKRAEEAVKMQAQVLENMAEGVNLCNEAGYILYSNPAFDAMFGYDAGELMNQHVKVLNALPPEENAKLVAAIMEVVQRQGTYYGEFLNRRKDGTAFTTRSRVTGLKISGQQYWISVQEDITARKRAEEALIQAASRERATLKVIERMRQTLESEQILRATTQELREILNCDRVSVYRFHPGASGEFVAESVVSGRLPFVGDITTIWQNCYFQETPEQQDYHHQAFVMNDIEQAHFNSEHIALLKQFQVQAFCTIPVLVGETLWGLLSAYQHSSCRHWQSGEIKLLSQVGIQLGIAVQQSQLFAQIQQQSRQLQKAKDAADAANRAKSEFLANMSHEIRTPMNAILGFCDLLKGLVIEPRSRNYLESIVASGKTLLALINDILDLSKIEAGKLQVSYEPVNVRLLIDEICTIFSQKATEKTLRLEAEIEETVPEAILFDEIRLRQILFNVVGNALKFTEQGCIKITMSSRESTDPLPPSLSPQSPGSIQLKLAVTDTGIGIAANQQTRIFDVFTQSEGQSTRKYGGTGLGLTITKRLTEMLGGYIELQSQPNQGSTFTFIFPQVAIANWTKVSKSTSQWDAHLNHFQAMTVLVVDDVKSNRDLIQGYFSGTKHQVLFAQDGQEAITMASMHQPNIILMDLRMPNMDGREAAQYLKQNPETQNIPIVILTASSRQEYHQSLQNLCQGFLNKPLSYSQLVDELSKILIFEEKQPAEHPKLSPVASSINPTTFSDTFSEKSLKNGLELLEKLQQEETILPQLSQTMKMRDLRKFSERLRQWGEEHNCQQLLDYAAILSQQIEQFDGEHLPQTIRAFSKIRQSLESFLVQS